MIAVTAENSQHDCLGDRRVFRHSQIFDSPTNRQIPPSEPKPPLNDTPITHWSVGVASSGATKILYSGTVTPNISVSNGVTPQLTTATAVTEG